MLYGMVTVKTSSRYTVAAVRSFFKHTLLTEQDRFILIDNDGDWISNWSKLVRLDPSCILLNDQPKTFSQNINQLFRLAESKKEDLIFISNDVIFTPNWYNEFVNNDNTVSIPSSNNYHGISFPYALSLDEFRGRYGILNQDSIKHKQRFPAPTESMYMPIFAAKFPYKIYSEIGFYDENFINGGEDVDYRIRAIKAGFDVKFCPAYLMHFNGKSTWSSGEDSLVTRHRESDYIRQLIEKWGEDLYVLLSTTNSMSIIKKYNVEEMVISGQFNKIVKHILDLRTN